MFISAESLVAHLVGDYLLQSDWQASEKTKKSVAAFLHALTYTLPFLLLTQSLPALGFILGTHFVIDRWRLARYVCWAKNWIAPKWITRPIVVNPSGKRFDPKDIGIPQHLVESGSATYTCPLGNRYWVTTERVRNHPWRDCKGTGYGPEKPQWMAVWLLILADNTLHVLCNGLGLSYL
jgi:hypothetical protein